MYRYSNGQISLADFKQPVGMNLKESNRWVKKAQTIPWSEIEKRYAALFTNHKGNVAKSLRLALGTVFFDTPFVSVYILPSQEVKRRLTYLSNELNNHIESPRSISERGLDLLVLI